MAKNFKELQEAMSPESRARAKAKAEEYCASLGHTKYSNMPIVMGIGHRARYGKDTVANMIKEERGKEYNIAISPFAAALKQEVNENALKAGGMRRLFGEKNGGSGGDPYEYMRADGAFVELPPWVQYDPDPPMDDPLCPLGKQRTLLQWWGSEFRRAIDPNYWVDKNAKFISESGAEIVLVPDMRFLNELDFCQEYGETIKVHRPNFDNGVGDHISETALAYLDDEDWSAVILNDGTLEDLRERALMAFDGLMEKVQRPSRS